MPKWKAIDDSYSCEITSDQVIAATDPTARALVDASQTYHIHLPLKRITLDLVGGQPEHYDWEIEADDGRIWTQRLHVTATTLHQSFTVPDLWDVEEFKHGRDLRDVHVRDLIRTFGMTKLRIDWS